MHWYFDKSRNRCKGVDLNICEKNLTNKPNYSSVCRLPKQQALNNPHRFNKKQVQHIFCCVFGYCKCCMSFEINLLPQSLKALFFVTLSVKHCELRTPGQRSSNRACGNDRTSFQAISALFWNYSTQIQLFLSNWYVLLIEKSNLKGPVQRKRNPINRNEFQIQNILCGLRIYPYLHLMVIYEVQDKSENHVHTNQKRNKPCTIAKKIKTKTLLCSEVKLLCHKQQSKLIIQV